MSRMVLGSVAEATVRATICSVLVIPNARIASAGADAIPGWPGLHAIPA